MSNRTLYRNKSKCSGCEVCANICPTSVISMGADEEGFYYPYIVDENKCIDCRRCGDVCPMKHIVRAAEFQETAYAGYACSEEEIRSCASGGLASAISRKFIRNGGVVYGVQYHDECQRVIFSRADRVEEIERYKTSKYVQAQKGMIYQRAAADLKEGRRILFIGLPCECYALELFLGARPENLYLCALICHGPTSQAVHTQYCSQLKKEHPGKISEFSVRYKKDGWKPYYIRTKFEDGYEHLEKFEDSTYGTAFLYLKRPSCAVCQIKRQTIHADITIGDYHVAYGTSVRPNHKDGVSSCIVHTERGAELIDHLEGFYLERVSTKNVLYSEAYSRAIPARKNRLEYGRVFAQEGLEAACELKSILLIERRLAVKRKILRYGSQIKRIFLRRRRI